ncbi:hypothetical protein BDP81DRAFT_193566 [Colletotrichum phormii]|uniref:Prefoldin subunit n=1 Tax=Colletotrichum phormii TaxID=359342 RepID=A0AAI9ZVH7_9PEZI|nr:uncharacterized protein BDP81DRAFT_193566 [Colletotrichum phormii]KAK1638923.1 hypothetical protein BDP81DRAFT_193566 [Colletotrichum phormii]
MRPPPISRSHGIVLTRGRWVLGRDWQALSQRHNYQPSHTAAAIQQTPSWQLIQPFRRPSQSHEAPKSPTRRDSIRIVRHERSIFSDLLLADAADLYRLPSETPSESKLSNLRFLAQLRSPQLSVITAQEILRQIPELRSDIARLLCNSRQWQATLRQLSARGHTQANVSNWAWIIIPRDPDKRVERFLSRPGHKPLFVLFYLLTSRPYFQSSESLLGLLRYCNEWYAERRKSSDNAPQAFDLDSVITPVLFGKLLDKLCQHASRLQPDALPDIAELSVAYIKILPHGHRHPDKAYRLQCQALNRALQAVSVVSKKSPYQYSSYNWTAVTKLLSLSSTSEKTLIIEEESYRAIRQVLLASPKTASERDTASTLASHWPPHRIMRDGMEEKAGPEAYQSRVVKAGVMMQEGGYSKKDFDLITDILGGMAPDGSPTVQTRANYPRHLRVEQGAWAAQIRTTRNAQEAWALFKHPPESGMKPTFEVYRELIAKLSAKPAKAGHHNLPGDGREVFPYNDENLSDFERARTNPPSIRRIVEEMYAAGIPIRGPFLAGLIKQSPSVDIALHHVDCSSLDEGLKGSIRQSLKDYQGLTGNALINPPHDILHAFIDLLCRLQPNRTSNTPPHISNKSMYSIHYAFQLAQMGWASADVSGRAPWETILFNLGRSNIMVSNSMPRENNIEVLHLAIKALKMAEGHSGLSLNMVTAFASVLRKAVQPRLGALLAKDAAKSPVNSEEQETGETEPRNPRVEDAAVSRTLDEDEEFLSLYQEQSNKVKIPKGRVLRLPGSFSKLSHRQLLHPIFQREELGHGQTPIETVQKASSQLKAAWRALATLGPASNPDVNKLVTAATINTYMRTLAFLGDREEMVLLMWWVVREWTPKAGGDLSLAHARYLTRAFRAFRAYAEPLLDQEMVSALREEVMAQSGSRNGGPMHWPSDEEVEEYIYEGEWGNHQNLHEVIKRGLALKQELPGPEEEVRENETSDEKCRMGVGRVRYV